MLRCYNVLFKADKLLGKRLTHSGQHFVPGDIVSLALNKEAIIKFSRDRRTHFGNLYLYMTGMIISAPRISKIGPMMHTIMWF